MRLRPSPALGAAVLLALASIPTPALAQDDPSASPGPDTTPAPTTPVPSVTFEPAVTLGADTELFTDSFDQELWGVGEQTRGSIAYQDEKLVIEVTTEDNSLWSWRSWSGASPVVRIEGSITFTNGVGNGGYMCGSAIPDFVLGGLNRSEWVVGQVVNGRTEIIERGPLPDGVDASQDEPVLLAIECALTGEGNTRALLSVEGTQVADVAVSEIGPFDRAAVYGGTRVPPASVAFDDVTVTVGDSYAPSTELPSPAPSASAPPGAGLPLAGLGADTLEFEDDFSDESQWVTGETDSGQVAYDDGALAINVTGQNQSLWTWRRLDAERPVVRIEGPVTINDADGAAGWTCGTSDGSFVIGIVSPTEWILGTIIDGQNAAIVRGPLPEEIDLSDGGTTSITLECGVIDSIGAPESRALMWVDGALVGDATANVGESFDRVGAYADVGDPPMEATFDDAKVQSGEVTSPVVAGEVVADLLSKVPEEFRDACSAVETGAEPDLIVAVECSPASEADSVVYQQFATPETMDRALDQLLERDGAETPGESCDEGASLTTWTVGFDEELAGRLACYAVSGDRTRFAWTESELSILTVGDDASLGYPEMYDWWLEAGPNR